MQKGKKGEAETVGEIDRKRNTPTRRNQVKWRKRRRREEEARKGKI